MLRISGLIKFADTVRGELAAPGDADQRSQLQFRVTRFVKQVDQILQENRATIRHIPAPSQRAYHFLTGIDWSKLDVGTAGEATAQRRPIVSWTGLTSTIDRMMDILSFDLADDQLKHAAESILLASRRIELTIGRDKVEPEQLSPLTRSQRGWLAYFSRPENLNAYVAARRSASAVLDVAAAGSRHYPPPLRIQFMPIRGIYKLRATRHKGAILSLPTAMISFNSAGFSAMAELIFQKSGQAKQWVITEMTGEAYQSISADLESLGGIVDRAKGANHDLAASFDRVNAAYFGGKMQRPRLIWNRTFTGRKFGHYDVIGDTIMVTRTLDSPTVPEFVVDFLVFHELLHKFHGTTWVNGRGYAHTAEFYESERKFAKYHEAEAILTKLARSVG